MSRLPVPPRLATWLLERALPDDVREDVSGDLIEAWHGQRATRGRALAALWYWKEALSFCARFAVERWSDRGGVVSLLDLKLALRMLVKYPGLTAVGGIALTVAIAVGAAWFEFAADYVNPRVPLVEGDRLVGLVSHDLETGRLEPGRSLHDFVTWRAELRSVEDVGAFRNVERNLITPDGRSEPVRTVEVSAAAFRVARIPPLLGRALVDDDERPAAPPVAVLGYELWQERFQGDPEVLGRVVQLGEASATVVGVMPAGFAFPVHHELWTPLRLDPLAFERGEGPLLHVFGRLAPGASLEQARAELTTLGMRAAADHPETNARLRPDIVPYVHAAIGIESAVQELAFGNLLFGIVLLVVGANVGTLIFARTATRAGEIVVRTALGASRLRIVSQLFAEALLLALCSAVAGLAILTFAMQWGSALFWAGQGGIELRPFWWNEAISPTTVLYTLGLAVLAAVVSGVLPGLRVTGPGVAHRLRAASAGGSGRRRGGIWTAVIVVQVAITAAFLPLSFGMIVTMADLETRPTNYGLDELLSARLLMDGDAVSMGDGDVPPPDRLAELQEELRRRILAEPGVVGAAYANGLPMSAGAQITVRTGGGAGGADDAIHRSRVTIVGEDFFATLGARLVTGRTLVSSDVLTQPRPVVVNESLARRLFGPRQAVGQRLRTVPVEGEAEGVPFEVVGVVADLGGVIDPGADPTKLYALGAPGTIQGARLAIRTAGDPEAFAPRLRALTAELSPSLRLHEVQSLARLGASEKRAAHGFVGVMALLGAVALLLSVVGVHALMSFAVAQRTREIGVRVALGADPGRIVTAIFRRAALQLTAGVGVGGGLILLTANDTPRMELVPIFGVVAVVILGAGLAACMAPARRALRIQPTEALRGE